MQSFYMTNKSNKCVVLPSDFGDICFYLFSKCLLAACSGMLPILIISIFVNLFFDVLNMCYCY